MKKFGSAVRTMVTILTALISILLSIFLNWCKWFGFAWVLSHFITSINPVDIGSILFIVGTIIRICVTLMFSSKNKETKSS